MASAAIAADKGASVTAWEASQTTNDSDMVTTGVARGRDRLDSATSTSAIKDYEITKLAPRTLAELFRNIPGIRSEAGYGDVNNNYTVRGLPLIGTGSKYIQFQEDGMPVMEFGNMGSIAADSFIRTDLNLASVESIRGGSASTFASNAPGGVINLVSKTGDVEGGSVQATAGLDYESYRMDFDYGGKLSETWRFHIGGFYREGEGPRDTGYTAYRGGQVKFNVTKDFAGGYIRFYGKVLDDHTPFYTGVPVRVSGTNANPDYSAVANTSLTSGTMLSPYISSQIGFGPDNQLQQSNFNDGYHMKSKMGGADLVFTLADWTVTERFRYSEHSGVANASYITALDTAAALSTLITGTPNTTLTYASGPKVNAGTGDLNGNGLLAANTLVHQDLKDQGLIVNDLRVSRVWNVAQGDLTTTFGVYKSRQKYQLDSRFATVLQDVAGDGNSALVNMATSAGPVTQNGFLSFSAPLPGTAHRFDVNYDVTAPYGSFNFHQGKLSVGGSVRYDYDRVQGIISQDVGPAYYDFDGNGVRTSLAEDTFARFPVGSSSPVNYSKGYLSYSTGINFRMSDNLAFFARYSLGSRAGADQILFTPAVSTVDGRLVDPSAAQDKVRQAEGGVKYRTSAITLNLTGFYVTASETSTQISADQNNVTQLNVVQRAYKTYGAEFEGSYRRGIFSLAANATLTGGEITAATNQPGLIGKTPRHQAALVYGVTPQITTNSVTLGANFLGQTSSYAQDVNQLKLPAFTTVGLFAQYSPVERVVLSLNASNVFNTKAFIDVTSPSIPTSGISTGLTLLGRTISTSARFFF